MGAMLHQMGHVGVIASTGRDLRSILQKPIPIDLLITDLDIADADGLDLVADARRLKNELPVIVVSGCPSVEKYLKAVNLGVFEYLPKPVSFDELQRLVQAVLNDSTCTSLTGMAKAATDSLADPPAGGIVAEHAA